MEFEGEMLHDDGLDAAQAKVQQFAEAIGRIPLGMTVFGTQAADALALLVVSSAFG